MREIKEIISSKDFRIEARESRKSWELYEKSLKKNFLKGQRFRGKRMSYLEVFNEIVKSNPHMDYVGNEALDPHEGLVEINSKKIMTFNNCFYTLDVFEAKKEIITGTEYIQLFSNPQTFKSEGKKNEQGKFVHVIPDHDTVARSNNPFAIYSKEIRRKVLCPPEKEAFLSQRENVFGKILTYSEYLTLITSSKDVIRICRRLRDHPIELSCKILREINKSTSLKSIFDYHYWSKPDLGDIFNFFKEIEEDKSREIEDFDTFETLVLTEDTRLIHPKSSKKKGEYSDNIDYQDDNFRDDGIVEDEVIYDPEIMEDTNSLNEFEDNLPGVNPSEYLDEIL